MTLTKELNGKALTIAMEGRLDTVTAPEVEPEVMAALDGIESLTMDFSKLDYISSAGLRLLLNAYKAMQGKGPMKVVHVSDVVMEVFDVTGFSDVLDIESD